MPVVMATGVCEIKAPWLWTSSLVSPWPPKFNVGLNLLQQRGGVRKKKAPSCAKRLLPNFNIGHKGDPGEVYEFAWTR